MLQKIVETKRLSEQFEKVESFQFSKNKTKIVRYLNKYKTHIINKYDTQWPNLSAQSAFDWNWLRLRKWPELDSNNSKKRIFIGDLFCGCGAMSLGIWEACRAKGIHMVSEFAIDLSSQAIETYNFNFKTNKGIQSDISKIFSYRL